MLDAASETVAASEHGTTLASSVVAEVRGVFLAAVAIAAATSAGWASESCGSANKTCKGRWSDLPASCLRAGDSSHARCVRPIATIVCRRC